MNTWYAFLALSATMGVLVAILAFAILRFGAAARDASRTFSDSRMDNMLMSSAIEEAITKLRAQERATAARAEASERLSEQIVASLTSGLLVVDRDHLVRIVNPAAHRMLSLPKVAVGTNYREMLRDAPALADLIGETLATKAPVLRRTAQVRDIHLGVGVSPLADDGAPAGAICLFTDLTKVVALEEQLRLQDSLAQLGELTAGLAHEFRNGLATIHGYARLLDPTHVPEPYRVYVHGIRDEAKSLGEVVTNFLNFAKPQPLSLSAVDLRALIMRAADDVPAAKVDLRGEFATIQGDEVLLRQAFSNLFRNSVDAAAPVKIALHIIVEAKIDLAAQTTTVEVQDNGPGVRADALAKVFQPFFTTRASGTGLGLAIVQKVVVSHNGRISAGNRPEGGAIFALSFPLVAGAHSQNL